MKCNLVNIQLKVHKEKLRTLESLEKTMEKVGPVADVVTLPEMFNCPYVTEVFKDYGEREGELTWQTLSRLAKEYQVYLSGGSIPEFGDDGKVYNTAYVFDPLGHQIAKHRKAHLFDIDVKGGQSFKESDILSAGNEIVTFDTSFGKMGLCICYDFRFPEMARLMALEGAKIILVPAAFNMTTGPAHWEILFRCRALDNQVYTVGTAPARDASSGYTSWGHSLVVDPWGKILNMMGEEEGYIETTLHLDLVEKVRQELPLLHHRRDDMYEMRKR